MEASYTLRRIDQLKAIADPLRQRMLEHMSREAMTTKQLAEEIGENPTKLYHHVNALEAAELIRLVKTKPNRGTTEKYYTAVARQFVVDHRLLSMSSDEGDVPGDLHAVIVNALADGLGVARTSFYQELAASEKACLPTVAGTLRVRLSRERALRVSQGLQSVLEMLQEEPGEDDETEFSVTLALFAIRPNI